MSARSLLIKSLPCIACEHEKLIQPWPTDEHHLNLGGRAGQKRRGDEYSIPLCRWHHQGHPPNRFTATQATAIYGPSLARSSKKFRERYGTDDELLAKVNVRLDMGTDMGIECQYELQIQRWR